MPQTQSTEEGSRLTSLKLAIEKLLEFSSQITCLAKKKLRPLDSEYKSLLADREAGISIADRVRQSANAIESFFDLKDKSELALKAFENGLHYMREAESADEILTLTGFTLLSDYRRYSAANTQFMRDYETKLRPMREGLMAIVNFSGEVNEVGRWLNKLLDYDTTTGDDEIVRMLNAMQRFDLDMFNKIYERTKKRMEAEQSLLPPEL